MAADGPSPEVITALQAFLREVPNWNDYGTITMGPKGQIQLSETTRDEVGLAGARRVVVFGSPSLGCVLIFGQPDVSVSIVMHAQARGLTQSSDAAVTGGDQ